MPVLANFLYYANAEMRGVFQPETRTVDDEKYAATLLEGDALFPDGIALALSYCRYARPETNPVRMLSSYRSMGDAVLPNLNGTDLLPELLVRFRKEFGPSASAYLYGTREGIVSKAASALAEFSGMPVGFQNGYSEFDFERFERFSTGPKILLVGLGTPKQELWTNEFAARFGPVLAVTVGGFFDFVGGGESRAPEIIRSLRLEWLWRVLLDPRKNGKKALASLRFFPRFFRGFR